MTFSENNLIEFLPSGVSSYKRRWQILIEAKQTIHLVTFSFMKDETTRKLFDLLKKKKLEGVTIRIIYDDIVNKTTFVGGWIKELIDAGIEVYPYNKLNEGWWIAKGESEPFRQIMQNVKLKLKQHFHEKYLIVDGDHLILGGINWGDKYAFGGIKPEAWRDTDVYIRGQVIEQVQVQFLSDWEMQRSWLTTNRIRYQEFALNYLPTYKNEKFIKEKYSNYFNPKKFEFQNKTAIAYVSHKPYDRNELTLTNLFLSEIKNARNRIYWGCHGIRPPRIFAEYLSAAVKRGVEVVLITNSRQSSKTLMVSGLLGWMYWECSKHFKYLIENGIRIFEWQKPGAFHSKNLIIDDDFVSIGSYNIANGSAFHHSESNVIIKDKNFCTQVFDQFKTDLIDCMEILPNTKKYPSENGVGRVITERYKMIDKDLLTDGIKSDLKNHNFKPFPFYEFIDIS